MSTSKARPEQVKKNLKERGLLEVAEHIAKTFFVPMDLLLGPKRPNSVNLARKALYRTLYRCALSTPEIGEILERDHSTILAGLRSEAPSLLPVVRMVPVAEPQMVDAAQ